MYKFKDNFIMACMLSAVLTISIDISKPQKWLIINKYLYFSLGVILLLIIFYAAEIKNKK